VASERQIAANQRNAKKSTGPKSDPGKKRSSKNAYRHGLSVPMSTVESEALLKELARQYAGDSADAKTLSLADIAADAQLESARIKKAQTALIERALMLDAAGARSHPELEELLHRIARNGWQGKTQGVSLPLPELLDSSTPLPGDNEEQEQRFVYAIQHILRELTKICPYEKRAAARRDRAIARSFLSKPANKKSCYSLV
jgi:hypothetical protein